MLLATYLNDHLAGATAGRELARRSAASNRGSALGQFLAELAQEVDEDRDALLALMGELQIGADRVKVLGGWAIEKLGRLKPNGRLLSYSPLSRLLELEGLILGVRGKLALWHALQTIEADEPALASADLGSLARRAERQLEELDRHRRAVVPEALRG
ncbi:MAG TPA: hypothetical protein VG188_03440 [Solirubrobacteraceae bacterium]|jgi:hypothetical protein|nr:hypothetical protein [Solirubrobacteraceae bacterium]